MSKLLVIFGATGQQGGSLVDYTLNDPELCKQYRVRAITRDPSKPAAQVLQQKGIEVVRGDMDDKESLQQALQGAHTVFAMTSTIHEQNGTQQEIAQGKALVDAVVAAGAQYLIWSTSPPALQHSTRWNAKTEVEEYIRGLPVKSAFYAPGSFMQNFQGVMAAHAVGDGSYVIANIYKNDSQLPLIDVVGDTGKFVGAILAEPDKFEGKVLSAAIRLYTFDEITQTMSRVTGKTIRYKELPEEVFRGFLPPSMADRLIEMMQLFRDYGYYGPEQKQLVEWTAQQARGKLTTLEEYLTQNPLNLQ